MTAKSGIALAGKWIPGKEGYKNIACNILSGSENEVLDREVHIKSIYMNDVDNTLCAINILVKLEQIVWP